jgi:hypothetical protein
MLVLLTAVAACAMEGEREVPKKEAVQVTVELKDGSRLVGKPLDTSLHVKLDFAKADIPLEQIRQCDVRHKDERVILSLQNGDKLTGTLEMPQFKIETALGKLAPEIAQIDRIMFSTGDKGFAPDEKGAIAFGGLNWLPWRTLFEVQDDKLVTLPKPRPGFNYGHNGSGRGPMLMSNIGNPKCKDYRAEFEYCVTGVDPALNPYGLPADYHDGIIYFHVADAKEDWNKCGSSAYMLAVHGDGSWSLECTYNDYCAIPCGYGNVRKDGHRDLAQGEGLKIDSENGNKFVIEVSGEHIQISVDGQNIADVTDDRMGETIGGQTLDHGGIGFHWGMDTMGWIRNFSLKPL